MYAPVRREDMFAVEIETTVPLHAGFGPQWRTCADTPVPVVELCRPEWDEIECLLHRTGTALGRLALVTTKHSAFRMTVREMQSGQLLALGEWYRRAAGFVESGLMWTGEDVVQLAPLVPVSAKPEVIIPGPRSYLAA